MADLNQLVEKALKTLDYVLEHPPIDGPMGDAHLTEINEAHLKVSAAAAVLEFAAAMSRAPIPEQPGCKHEDRINMSTMGSKAVVEVCRQCNARLENGVVVKE